MQKAIAATISDFSSFIDAIIDNVLTPVVSILFILAFIYFLIGVFKYLRSAGDETERRNGVTMMTYGIIALFVFVSVWGLVNVLKRTFTLSDTPVRPPAVRAQ